MNIQILLRRIKLLSFCSFISISVYSQQNFMEATIIDLQGDSITGLIDYRNWEKNPHKISFKNGLGGTIKSYDASQIKGFRVADEKYMGAIVQTEISPRITNELITDPELVLKLDTVFLQTIYEGSKSLYYVMNSVGNDQFYIMLEGKPELLKYKKYLITEDNKQFVNENNLFVNQLGEYLQNCQDIQQQLGNLKYDKKSMHSLFDYYFTCTNTNANFARKNEKVSVLFGGLAGVSSTKLIFSGSNNDALIKANFSSSINFAGGVFFDVIFLRNLKKWSLCNELIYSAYATEGQFTKFVDQNQYATTTTKFAYHYLKYNLLLRYRYDFKTFSMFGNAGMSNGFAISETNYSKTISTFYSTVTTKEERAIPDARKYEQGLLLGLGATFKKFSIEGRYEGGNGMSDYASLRAITNRKYLLIGYRF